MTMNDLTAPLGQDPNKTQRAVAIPAAKSVALGLFFAAFVLWAIIAEDRFGGQPIAVAPADLQHIAKKAPAVIAVPQAAAPVDAAQATTTATLPPATAAAGSGKTAGYRHDHHRRRQDRRHAPSGGCGAAAAGKRRYDRSTATRSTGKEALRKRPSPPQLARNLPSPAG